MVYNSISMVKLPHHDSSNMRSISAGSKHGTYFMKGSGMHGCGTGSVLLRTAGGGAGSSYMDMDDYISTTGINPYTRAGVTQGRGLSKEMTSKLSKLQIAPPSSSGTRKNIVMSM
jgi:hypothetical protein